MIEIRNLKFQPLTLHLANSKRTVHLASRGRAEIDDKDVSVEIRNAAQKRFLTLREVKKHRPAKTVSPPKPDAPAQPPKATAPGKGTSDGKDKKERG